jgi:hypothetical protein
MSALVSGSILLSRLREGEKTEIERSSIGEFQPMTHTPRVLAVKDVNDDEVLPMFFNQSAERNGEREGRLIHGAIRRSSRE